MQLLRTMNQTDKGRMWRAINSAVGTPIAVANSTAFSDTAAIFALFNNSAAIVAGAAPPGRMIYPSYLRLIVAASQTTATSFQLAVSIDTKQRGVTADSGTQKTVADSDGLGVDVSAGAPMTAATSISIVQFGALTPTAQSPNRRFVLRSSAKTQAAPALTVGDEIFISFGGDDLGPGPISGAAASRIVVPSDLVSIGPGGLMLVHAWGPAGTVAAQFEYEAGWAELS